MADCADVTLTVLTSQKGIAEKLFGDEMPSSDYANGILFEFHFDSMNRGNLPFMDRLVREGIAFNSRWMDGDNYAAGTNFSRFSPKGEFIQKIVYDEDVNPPLASLMRLRLIPDALIGFIEGYHSRVTPLPWDKQEEYGQLYQMMNLLVPA